LAIYRNFYFQCRFTGSGNALSSLLIVGQLDINPTFVQHPPDIHGARRVYARWAFCAWRIWRRLS
jgi:hypothetical protein